MMWMVILLAMQGREAEQAAREFDEGMRQFQENRHEKAIEAFDAALKLRGVDGTLRLFQAGVVQNKNYQPYHFKGLAALRWAASAGSLEEKQRRLDLAISSLVNSGHADRDALLAEARRLREATDRRSVPTEDDPAPLALRGRFDEALRLLEQSAYWKGREDERKAQEVRIREEQAKAIVASAVALATAAFLEGEPREQAARRLAPLMAKAQALDPGALAGLGDVSPKILAMLDGAKGR
jgi:tetratricopeptide (TPR) repeat protein